MVEVSAFPILAGDRAVDDAVGKQRNTLLKGKS